MFDTFHAVLLTPYVETETHGPTYPEPPAEIIDNQPEWEVDQIIKHRRTTNGNTEYHVLWKGYGLDQATWEPKENLDHAPEILRDYQQRLRKRNVITNVPEQNKQTTQSRNRRARTRKKGT